MPSRRTAASASLAERIKAFDVAKLTPRNYFSKKNLALSPSKAKLFLRSKSLFHDVLTGARSIERTDAMRAGSVMDWVVTRHGAAPPYHPKFGTKHDRYITKSKYDDAVRLGEYVRSSPYYGAFEGAGGRHQVLLRAKVGVLPLCGMADGFIEREKTIDDYKMVSPSALRSPRAFYFHALEQGWFMQLAAYRHLASIEYGGDESEWACRIVALAMDRDGVIRSGVYRLGEDDLAGGLSKFLAVSEEIVGTTEWSERQLGEIETNLGGIGELLI